MDAETRASDLASAADGTAPSPRAVVSLLENTARDVEAWRAEAETEAAALLSAAKAEAERVVESAHAEADKMLGRARGEVARLERLGAEYRRQLRQHAEGLLTFVDAHDDLTDAEMPGVGGVDPGDADSSLA